MAICCFASCLAPLWLKLALYCGIHKNLQHYNRHLHALGKELANLATISSIRDIFLALGFMSGFIMQRNRAKVHASIHGCRCW